MDLTKHLKRGLKIGSGFSYKREKKCLGCSKVLEKDNSYLYFQGFCSSLCKEKYMEL